MPWLTIVAGRVLRVVVPAPDTASRDRQAHLNLALVEEIL